MEATVTKLFEYLNLEKINKIPVYQRNYDWEKENCKQFYNDIVRSGQEDNIKSHFIGSIIAIVNSNMDTNKAEHIVIDGQQRITTSFLFLKALYDVESGQKSISRFVQSQLFNIEDNYNEDTEDIDEILIPKLELNTKDDLVLNYILESNEAEYENINQASRVLNNYKLFKDLISETKDKRLLIKGFKKLSIVAISLQPNDEPQSIFEALNSTGMKLKIADLIRNYLLMKDSNNQKKLYDNFWYQIENYLPSQELEEFIKAFTMIKTGKNSTVAKLYSDFKIFITIQKWTSEKTLKELLFYAKLYNHIIFDNTPDKIQKIKDVINDIQTTKLKVFLPVILEAYAKYERDKISEETFLNILLLLENYLIRNVLAENPSNGYNKYVPQLILKLNSFESFQQLLINKKAKGLLFVSDKVLREKLLSANIYDMQSLKRGKYLFYRLETFQSKETIKIDDITVEHIFPQKPKDEWKKVENWKSIHSELLHTLGNLTVTGYNSEMGNKPFAYKNNFFKDSNISLNREIARNSRWTEIEIRERTNLLIDKICEVWKEPTGLNDDSEILEFELSDFNEVDLKDREIQEFMFLDTSYSVNNWQDFYFVAVQKFYLQNSEDFQSYVERDVFKKFIFSKKTTKTKQVFGIPIYLQTGIRTAKTLLKNLLKIDRTLNSHNNTEFTITLKVSDI